MSLESIWITKTCVFVICIQVIQAVAQPCCVHGLVGQGCISSLSQYPLLFGSVTVLALSPAQLLLMNSSFSGNKMPGVWRQSWRDVSVVQAACCGCFVFQWEAWAATVATGKVSIQGGRRMSSQHLLESDVNAKKRVGSIFTALQTPYLYYVCLQILSSGKLPSFCYFQLLFSTVSHTDNYSFNSYCAGCWLLWPICTRNVHRFYYQVSPNEFWGEVLIICSRSRSFRSFASLDL